MPRNLILKTEDYLNIRFPKREQYAKGVAIALISAIAGNSLKTDISCPLQTKSNVFVLICGQSGSGKSTIVGYGMDIIEHAQFVNIITDDTTPESLAIYLNAHPYGLMRMDEFTKLIGSYRKKTYMAGLREALVKAYDGIPLIQIRSTRIEAKAINYALCAIADTQPITISEEATETDVQSGFLPRFNWFHLSDPVSVKPTLVTDDVLEIRNELIRHYRELHSIALHNEINFIFNNNDLRQIYDRLFKYQVTEQTHLEPFYKRVTMFAVKFAMLYQFAEPDFKNEFATSKSKDEVDDWGTDQSTIYNKKICKMNISPAAVSWAIEFMQDMVENEMPKTFKILKLNDSDKIVDAVERYEKLHNAPIPESLLYRSVLHTLRDAGYIQRAIDLALKTEMIQRNRVQGGVNYSMFGKFTPKRVEDYKNEPQEEEEDEDK